MSGATAGAVFLAQAVGEMCGGLLGGVLSDRFGHRQVMIIATGGMIVGYGSLAFIDQPVPAIAAFFVAGVFESAFHPAIGALVADTTEPERLTTAYSWVRVGAHTGHMLAVTNRPLVLLVVAGGLLAVTLTWFEADGLTILNSQHPLGTTAYAGLFTVMAVVTVVFQIPVTRLTSRFSASSVLVAGALIQGCGPAALLAAGRGYPALLVAAVLLAAGQMLYGPTATTVIARTAPVHARGTFQAAFSVTEDIGSAIGPITGLAVVAAAGAGTVWSIAALTCALTGAVAALASRSASSAAARRAARR